MRVSVVINTYNRMHTLPTTLSSLRGLRYPDLEVVVVDGPSTDGTLDYLEREWRGKVKICRCAEANLSKSRNVGIQNASGDIVCFTDDDAVPEPDWLDEIVKGYTDPEVGAVGGWVRNHTGVDYQTKYIISSRDSTSEVLVEDAAKVPAAQPNAETFPGMIGVNSSFRRSALVAVGGFDETYAYFLDETDVLVRMVDAGFKVACNPEAEVHHKYAPSHIRAENGSAKSWLQIMTSTAYYMVRNAAPTTSIVSVMEKAFQQGLQMRTHTDWYLRNGIVDAARHRQLIDEIERGFHAGIRDAFQYPLRRLIGWHPTPEWRPFNRLSDQSNRLRLAFVTPLYPPRPCGGVAVFIHHLARQLASAGHEITVITEGEPGRPHTVDFEEGVWVHRLAQNDKQAVSLPVSMPDMPGPLAAASGRVLAELDRVNRRRRFQYVIGAIWDLDLAAVIASRRYATAMYLVTSYKLMEESKPEWHANSHFYENHVLKMIDAERWALSEATVVLASTQAILQDIESAYDVRIAPEKVHVLPFGIPETKVQGEESAAPAGGVSLLYVGRFEHRKGIDLLFDCLPELLQQNANLRVTCIGDSTIKAGQGPTYLEEFRRKYEGASWWSRLSFPGHVSDKELEAAYAQCDLFVAPSRYESFGLIYLEAMRHGKPCIGPDAGGVPEVIVDNQTGLLVPPGDAKALGRAIGRLIADARLRSQLGGEGRNRFQHHFTSAVFASRFEKLAKGWVAKCVVA